jgi:hypothetical protein
MDVRDVEWPQHDSGAFSARDRQRAEGAEAVERVSGGQQPESVITRAHLKLVGGQRPSKQNRPC